MGKIAKGSFWVFMLGIFVFFPIQICIGGKICFTIYANCH